MLFAVAVVVIVAIIWLFDFIFRWIISPMLTNSNVSVNIKQLMTDQLLANRSRVETVWKLRHFSINALKNVCF